MRKALLVSLDAVFDADLKDLDPDGELARLMREGTCCTKMKTIFPALTYPAHVTLVTGCDPEKTGIGHNQPRQTGTPANQRKWYWESKHIRVPTLFEKVREAGGSCCSIFWPVNCKNPSVRWLVPEVHPLPEENAVKKAMQYGSPLFCFSGQIRFGKMRRGIEEPELSDFSTALTADTIRRHKPDFTALHLIDTDTMRHHYGTFSREAKESLRRHDLRLKMLRETLETTPGMENTLIAVVSDHGQADIDTEIRLAGKLEVLGLGKTLIPQSSGFSAYLFPGPEAPSAEDVETWESIARTLEAHQKELGCKIVYRMRDLKKMHTVPGPVLALEAAEGIAYSDDPEEGKREKATHGFGPGHPAENCLMILYGKGIRKGGRIDSIPMRDMAPTLAEFMGLSLPEAQGISHAAEFSA